MKLLDPGDYQVAAVSLYEAVSKEVLLALPRARVEHVGSSSIPGAISKGDLDICVVVAGAEHKDAVVALSALGYKVKGRTLRTPELCMLLAPRDGKEVALQVIAAGSKFEFFMQFRDALLVAPELVAAYNKVKARNISKGAAEYRRAKAAFIKMVLNVPLDHHSRTALPPFKSAIR